MPIADLPDDRFREMLREMLEDPSGSERLDLVAILVRVGFDKRSYQGHDYYVRQDCGPIYLPDNWNVVSVELAQHTARIALEILGVPKP